MDESDHLTLVNVGDEEVVNQEEGEREGGAAGGEGGGCCCVSAIAIAHMRAHRERENRGSLQADLRGALQADLRGALQVDLRDALQADLRGALPRSWLIVVGMQAVLRGARDGRRRLFKSSNDVLEHPVCIMDRPSHCCSNCCAMFPSACVYGIIHFHSQGTQVIRRERR